MTTVESMRRYMLFPIRHPELWKMYLTHRSMFWTPDELDLSEDYRDYHERLNSEEQRVVASILAFFSFGDGMVMENLVSKFFEEIEIPEMRQFLAIQTFMEAIHAETYAAHIEVIFRTHDRINDLHAMVESSPSLSAKIEWMHKYMDSSIPLIERIIAYACVEGIMFSSSFACIYYFKDRNVLKGVQKSNELIARDEGIHRDCALLLFKTLTTPEERDAMVGRVHQIVTEATELEERFMEEAIQAPLLGLSVESMQEYIRYVSDHLLKTIGLPVLYGARNPLSFMEKISLTGKANFFETRPTEYSLFSSNGPQSFKLDEEF